MGPGHYETLVEVGRIAGAPMLTFTAPHGMDHVEHTDPSPEYLAMLGEGIRDAHGWGDEELARYFDRLAGRRLSLR